MKYIMFARIHFPHCEAKSAGSFSYFSRCDARNCTGEQLRWPLSVQCQVLPCKWTCCLHETSHSSASLFPSCPVPTPSLRAPRALEPVSGRPSEVRRSLKLACPWELTLRTLFRLSCRCFVMSPPHLHHQPINLGSLFSQGTRKEPLPL